MEKAGAGAAFLLPPGLILGVFWLPALVFAGIGNRTAYLAFLEFIAPFMVAVGGSVTNPATGAQRLGAATIRFTPDAAAK